MYPTIIQNGALYAIQHRVSAGFRSGRRQGTIHNKKIIRAGNRLRQILADHKIKKEEACFI